MGKEFGLEGEKLLEFLREQLKLEQQEGQGEKEERLKRTRGKEERHRQVHVEAEKEEIRHWREDGKREARWQEREL